MTFCLQPIKIQNVQCFVSVYGYWFCGQISFNSLHISSFCFQQEWTWRDPGRRLSGFSPPYWPGPLQQNDRVQGGTGHNCNSCAECAQILRDANRPEGTQLDRAEEYNVSFSFIPTIAQPIQPQSSGLSPIYECFQCVVNKSNITLNIPTILQLE